MERSHESCYLSFCFVSDNCSQQTVSSWYQQELCCGDQSLLWLRPPPVSGLQHCTSQWGANHQIGWRTASAEQITNSPLLRTTEYSHWHNHQMSPVEIPRQAAFMRTSAWHGEIIPDRSDQNLRNTWDIVTNSRLLPCPSLARTGGGRGRTGSSQRMDGRSERYVDQCSELKLSDIE